VKFGLRLQILLLLGGLMMLAFVPLFFAVATYTNYALKQIRESNARALGRAIAGHVAEARARRSTTDLMSLLDAEIGTEGVEAIGVYGRDGVAIARAGEPTAVDSLSKTIDPRQESVFEVKSAHGRAIAVAVPDDRGAVIAVLRTDDDAVRSAPLLRLVGLYTSLVALLLLVLAYFALTRLIVRPLDSLTHAAERVAQGARRLEVPISAPRELVMLGSSLHTMTEKLISDEAALRKKISEVERATQELKAAQDRLVRSERLASVGRLAAGLAHEIGNPLAALMGLQDLLLAGGLDAAEQRDFLQRMRRETERIHGILRDLLQFARPGTEAAPGESRGNVEAAVEDTAALVQPQKAMKDIALKLELDPALPEVTLGREQLVQVLLNLILNAADACESQGQVTVRARPTAGGVRLEVEDDGPGVLPAVRERLFEPFVTTKEVGKGTGLGLAVCRGLVEAAGGSISLDASSERGARFVVELPRARATARGSGPPA
jgi:two-component system, NtrC family, sensor kinase